MTWGVRALSLFPAGELEIAFHGVDFHSFSRKKAPSEKSSEGAAAENKYAVSAAQAQNTPWDTGVVYVGHEIQPVGHSAHFLSA